MDLRQSKEFARYMKSSGWVVEKVNACYVYLRKLPLLPPLIMKLQYPDPPVPFGKVEKLVKKYKPLKVEIQPLKKESGFEKHAYKLGGGGHVTKTLLIDLTQSEKKILSQMKKDARYGIRKAEKEKLQIIEVIDLEKFHGIWRQSVGWRKYVPSLKTLNRLKKAFGKRAVFLAANDLAGTVILLTGDSAYYYYAFTSKKGRREMAQYLLVWKGIKLSKKRGCRLFDFEGIYDKRFPVKAWQGFSHFKKSFGGKEIEYPGCFTRSRLRK